MEKELTTCMEALEAVQLECSKFYGLIEDFEAKEAKEKAKKDGRKDKGPRRTQEDDDVPEIKGTATVLKPEELTTSVAAQDISL